MQQNRKNRVSIHDNTGKYVGGFAIMYHEELEEKVKSICDKDRGRLYCNFRITVHESHKIGTKYTMYYMPFFKELNHF